MDFLHPSKSDLVDYAEGDLSPRRTLSVKEHLGRCRTCAVSLARMREAASAAAGLGSALGPPGLRQRVAATVQAELRPITCREAAPLVHEALDRCLSPLGALALQQHLAACCDCRAELGALTMAARLVKALPEIEAPAGVRQRVAVSVRGRSRPAPAVLAWRPALAAAGVLLVLGGLALMKPARQTEEMIAGGPAVSASPRPAPVELASAQPEAAADTAPVAEPAMAVEASAELTRETELAVSPSVSSRHTGLVRMASLGPKGPATARTTPERPMVRVAMPAAFAALRTVANRAADETEVHRAMQIASERFATLRSETLSEATLVSLPSVSYEHLSDDRGSNAVVPDSHGSGQGNGARQRSSTSAPLREGAGITAGPFV